MTEIDFDALLANCAKEEIHLLGEIQSFACLFAVDSNFKVTVTSANIGELSNKITSGVNLQELITSDDMAKIQHFIDTPELKSDYSISLNIASKIKKLFCFKSGGLVFFEHEFTPKIDVALKKEALIQSLTGLSLDESDYDFGASSLASRLAENIKRMTDYDRVMIYRFHPDLHGEVIAEAKNDSLEPFLGLHYPESDIPAQARRLFLRNQVRLISDVNGERVKLGGLISKEKIDLSDSISRHSAVVHLEYLRNMGVSASLTISIVVDGKLWGLIACHHYSPKFVSFSDRAFLKLVGFSFASEVSKLVKTSLSQRSKSVNMIVVSLIKSLSKTSAESNTNSVRSLFDEQKNAIMNLMKASGFYIRIGGEVARFGDVPSDKVVKFFEKKLSTIESNPVFYTNCLSEEDSQFEKYSEVAAGAIGAGFVSGESHNLIIWFRSETSSEIRWAGKDDKTVVYDGKSPRLSPRGSFDEVVKVTKGRSSPFSAEDTAVAFEFLWFMNKILLQQLSLLQKDVEELRIDAERKDLFISHLSHELITPLNNILGWLQISEGLEGDVKQMRELTDVVKRNSEQQLVLVTELLDLSKITSGKLTVDLELNDLVSITTDLFKFFKPSFNNKGIKFDIKLHAKSARCYSDRVRIEQVLRNLIQNALKFTPKGGEVFITLAKDQSDVRVSIKDTGTGISRGDLGKVTSQFYQADSSAKRQHTGMGLGLALADSLMVLMGGGLVLRSDGIGFGTTAELSLPIAAVEIMEDREVKQPAVANNSFQPSKLSKLKILLIEDTIESARFLRIYLEREQADVTWCSNALDALEKLKSDLSFDVVVSDIGMPGMDGLQLVKAAKLIPGVDRIPFLALSAYGTKAEKSASVEAGFEMHLVKPVIFSELKTAIEKVIS